MTADNFKLKASLREIGSRLGRELSVPDNNSTMEDLMRRLAESEAGSASLKPVKTPKSQ